jgi:hypothetical protein
MGPYKILKKIYGNSYMLYLPDNMDISPIFDVVDIYEYHEYLEEVEETKKDQVEN